MMMQNVWTKQKMHITKAIIKVINATRAYNHTQAAIDNYKKFDPEGYAKANSLTYSDKNGATQNLDIHLSSGVVNNFDKGVTMVGYDKDNTGQLFYADENGKIIPNAVKTVIDINTPDDGNVLPHEVGHA